MKLKITFIAFILLLISLSCMQKKQIANSENVSAQKNDQIGIEKIELSEQTRGTRRLISINHEALSVDLNGNKSTSKITNNDWLQIVEKVKQIDLEKLSTYPSLTTGRFSDAALASGISITAKGKIYRSVEFDSDQPPVELKSLYELIKKSTAGSQNVKDKLLK